MHVLTSYNQTRRTTTPEGECAFAARRYHLGPCQFRPGTNYGGRAAGFGVGRQLCGPVANHLRIYTHAWHCFGLSAIESVGPKLGGDLHVGLQSTTSLFRLRRGLDDSSLLHAWHDEHHGPRWHLHITIVSARTSEQ